MPIVQPLQVIPPYDALPETARGLSAMAMFRQGENGLGMPTSVNLAPGVGVSYTSPHSYYCVGFDYFYLLVSPTTDNAIGINAILLDPTTETEMIEVPWGTASGWFVINRVEQEMRGVALFKLKFFAMDPDALAGFIAYGLYMSRL